MKTNLCVRRAHTQVEKRQLLVTEQGDGGNLNAPPCSGEKRRECVILAGDLGRDVPKREHLGLGERVSQE